MDSTIICMRLLILGFVDIVCRFSNEYIGWLSYILRPICLGSYVYIGRLSTNDVVLVFRFVLGILLIFLSWFLMLMFEHYDKQSAYFPTYVFIMYAHLQFFIGASITYICRINTHIRFIAFAHAFLICGILLQMTPTWMSNTIIITTMFTSVLTILYLVDIGMSDYLEKTKEFVSLFLEQFMEFVGINVQEFDTILTSNDRRIIDLLFSFIRYILLLVPNLPFEDFLLYVLIMAPATLTYYFNCADTQSDHDIKWIVLSSLGACCSTVIAARSLMYSFLYLSEWISKIFAILMKGFNVLEQQHDFLLPGFRLILWITFWDLFYDMPTYKRGEYLVNKLWVLLALLTETCFAVVYRISKEVEIRQGNFRSCCKVVVLHFVFILLSVCIVYEIASMYSMADLTVCLTVSSFIVRTLLALGSLLVFLLYKLDTAREEFWEHFDDVIFYIEFVLAVFEIAVDALTVGFAIWILWFGSFTYFAIFQLCYMCYDNIYKTIVQYRHILNKRRNIVRFTEELADADYDQIINHNDVCSICMQYMETAKVIDCNHMFHEMCIRKWFYSQLTCPICNRDVIIDP